MRKKQPTGGGIAIEAANPTDWVKSVGLETVEINTINVSVFKPYRLG